MTHAREIVEAFMRAFCAGDVESPRRYPHDDLAFEGPGANFTSADDCLVKCECGFEARGQQAELVPEVQKHGREAHNMDATPEQVLAMARPV